MTPFATAQTQMPPAQSPADAMLAQEQAQIQQQQQAITADYWAAQDPAKVLVELKKKEIAFNSMIKNLGFYSMWRIMRAQYHGLDPDDTRSWSTQQVLLDGDQGELLRFRVNESRSFIKQLITMAIGTRPSFECMATNSDYDSMGQAESADELIEYVYRSEYGETKEWAVIENGVLFGVGWTWLNWDANGGEPVTQKQPVFRTLSDGSQQPSLDPKTQQPLMREIETGEQTGELVLKSLGPWDVFHEPYVQDPGDHLWRVVREKRSRWEVASTFPEKKDVILAMVGERDVALETMIGIRSSSGLDTTDEIVVKHFYHRPSRALSAGGHAQGRHIIYVDSEPLLDEPLNYTKIPVVRFCPNRYIGTSMGYADAWDLCAINQMQDQVTSDCASNLSTFGRQSVWIEDGTSITTQDIANGMSVLKGPFGGKPPQPVSLIAVPAVVQWFLDDYLPKRYQSISNLNAVSRGDPGANIKSGQMAALFHSIAIESNSALQQAVDAHREEVANLILEVLKRFAKHPMIAKIVGIDERPYLDTFTRDSFSGIHGVRIKTSNPMMRTQAGRMQLGEMLLKIPNAVTSPEQMTEILVSGQIKPMYDSPRKKRLRIKLEDEMLLELADSPPMPGAQPPTQQRTDPPKPPLPNGVQLPPPPPYSCVPTVPVLWLDDHRAHIAEHSALLTSREALENPTLRSVVMAHIDEHMHVWRGADPSAMTALGLPLFPMPAMPAPSPMPANNNAGTQGVPQAASAPAAMQQGQQTEAGGVKLPSPSQSPVPNNSGVAA